MSYDTEFYALETAVALRSAAVVLPPLLFPGQSVIDIGCGTGGWAFVAQVFGCHVHGVDGAWVPEELRLIPIIETDLNEGIDCTGYDLAICLEVVEHLDDGIEVVRGLAQAERVLFSAATPGQPGVGHINCKDHSFWHEQFAMYGLTPTHIGPTFTDPVADFYQRNMFLYTKE